MIPTVLVQVPRQSHKVKRLIRHCLELDDTEIVVLYAPPSISDQPHTRGGSVAGAQLCFEFAMKEMKGSPFFWMEVDAIPLHAGWNKAITAEYAASGKKFLLPDLTGLEKGDVASAIGIYPADAVDIIPHGMTWPELWDLWIYRTQSAHICYTRLIQHSYAMYAHGYLPMRDWCFPEDAGIIRADALLFHRDPEQSLLSFDLTDEELFERRRALHRRTLALLEERRKEEQGRLLSSSAHVVRKNLSTSAELFYHK